MEGTLQSCCIVEMYIKAIVLRSCPVSAVVFMSLYVEKLFKAIPCSSNSSFMCSGLVYFIVQFLYIVLIPF